MQESIIDYLKNWRNEDQEDSIVLNRNQIINILEEYKNLEDSRQVAAFKTKADAVEYVLWKKSNVGCM